MTLTKIPIVGASIPISDIFASLLTGAEKGQLKTQLAPFVNKKHLFFTSSGLASFFVILESLKKFSGKKDVILPAYTASSLVTAIKRAALRPVLCDISLDDFNMDTDLLPDLVSKDTLCILGVHMFGIVNTGLTGMEKRFPDVFVVEDSAQAMGSKIDGVPCGNLADISFFSFNRGKNLPTYGGGFIATGNEALAAEIKHRAEGLNEEGLFFKSFIPFKILALSLGVRPLVYGLGYPVISHFKEVGPPSGFKVKRYTGFQARLASLLFKEIEEISRVRYKNGMEVIRALRDIEGLIVPGIPANTQPAFNRLPILFKELGVREKVEADLWRAGIESSRMYHKPLHHILDLGYKRIDFPNATYFAERLLTLPIHPLVDEEIVEKMIDIIKREFT